MSELSSEEAQKKSQAFSHPLFLPAEFKSYLEDFAARTATDFYVAQAEGFRGGRFVSARPLTDTVTVNSTADWGDPASDPGCSLEGLQDGLYIFIFGYQMVSPFVSGFCSCILEVNGDLLAGQSDEQEQEVFAEGLGNAWGIAQFQLSNNNDNDVWMRFLVGSAGVRIEKRFMHAVKVRDLTYG